MDIADTCGPPTLTELDPAGATTRGVGEIIAAALDEAGNDLPRGGAALSCLDCLDVTRLRPPPPGGVQLLTDIGAALTGPHGAAAVVGPQKGATPEIVTTPDWPWPTSQR